MGFMSSAFAGGMAKGYLAGKERRAAEARYEREFQQKQDEIDARLRIAEINQNLTKDELLQEKIKTGASVGLVAAGDGMFTSEGNNQLPYLHPEDIKNADGTGINTEATAYKRFNHYSNIYASDTAEGKALRESRKLNPEIHGNYLTNLYDTLSKIRERDSDDKSNTLFRMHMIRISPMMGEDINSITDLKTHERILNDFDNVGNGVTLKDYIRNRNQGQLNQALRENSGKYSYKLVKNKQGIESYVLFKDGKMLDGKPISGSEAKELQQLGYLDLANPTQSQKNFQTVLKVARSLQDVDSASPVDDIVTSVASMLYDQREELNLGTLFDNAGKLTSRDDFIINLAQKTKTILDQTSPPKLIGKDKNIVVEDLGLRETVAEAAVLAFFIDRVAPNAYTLQKTGGEYLFQRKYVQNPLDKKAIDRAVIENATANDGIGQVESILEDSLSINVKFLQSGQAYSSTFDVGFRLKSAIDAGFDFAKNLPNFFGRLSKTESQFFLSTVRNDRDVMEKSIASLRDSGQLTDNNVMAEHLTNIETKYQENVNQLLYQKQQGLFLQATGGDETEAERIFKVRMGIESKKVRLAFKLASLVQGGGTGGGRTISNADFEVIYNSLFAGGTGASLKNNLLIVRHELSKAKFRSKMIQAYGQLNRHNQMSEIGNALLDAFFNRATKRTGDNQYDSKQSASVRINSKNDATQQQQELNISAGTGVLGLRDFNEQKFNDIFQGVNESQLMNFHKLGQVTPQSGEQAVDKYQQTFVENILPTIINNFSQGHSTFNIDATPELVDDFSALKTIQEDRLGKATNILFGVLTNSVTAGKSAGIGMNPEIAKNILRSDMVQRMIKQSIKVNYIGQPK